MCGINGVNRDDPSLIRAMNAVIRHRGPDDEGTFVDDRLSLGTCRLKVIDLTPAGHQPFVNEDGTCSITYNGEIYNFREVRKDLEAVGRRFISDSDTEVILQAYETWGVEALSHLEGMWAFAIYDAPREEVLLARDRMGIKPLYYLSEGPLFVFSSELKTFTIPSLRRPIDPTGIRQLLALGFNPCRRTALDGVQKLRAGEFLRYSLRDGTLTRARYWDRRVPRARSPDNDRLSQVLEHAVERNLVSDVPVGCYVSGGIDSSIVAILYSRKYAGRLHTYTAGFEGIDDERAFGRDISTLTGSEHHEVMISPEEVERDFDAIAYSYDLSLTGPAFVPSYYLARTAKRDVTVVLAGEGGDELFGGYDYYRMLNLLQKSGVGRPLSAGARVGDYFVRRVVRKSRYEKTLALLSHAYTAPLYLMDLYSPMPVAKAKKLFPGFPYEETAQEFAAEIDQEHVSTRTPGTGLLLDQMFILPEKYNAKGDKASSAFSVEERVPLEDTDVVNYANSLSLSDKVSNRQGKRPLREVLRSFSPGLAERAKQGFGVPVREWFVSALAPRLEGAVTLLAGQHLVDPVALSRAAPRLATRMATEGESRLAWYLVVVAQMLRRYGYAG
ncbi:MAG: asparagine synthase (glutamine-hydrolyzing) [Thermoplasmata archaeon]|nr:asparagine synthase (glutamine-hydrolyzing) [Thermoplasmata archaeon]